MFRRGKTSRGDDGPSWDSERADAEWAQIERMLDARPLPGRCPDVREAVLARIQAASCGGRDGWQRLFRPFLNASAWGLAGAVAGLLFLSLLNAPAASPLDALLDSEVAAAPLMTDDLVILTRMDDLDGMGERP